MAVPVEELWCVNLYETSASVANHETLVPLEPPVSHVQESQGMTL